jgi:hypothetical protein
MRSALAAHQEDAHKKNTLHNTVYKEVRPRAKRRQDGHTTRTVPAIGASELERERD